jgi:UDP-N-acetylmuramyl pentapeptide phosphotransferase/UDP-N-acetylglucosamine-1-phosphate transferase
MDQPNDRSLHTTPVPKGAGLGELVGLLAGLTVGGGVGSSAFLGILGFSGLGAIDDWRAQPARVRLVAQLLLSLGVVGLTALQWPNPAGLALWVLVSSWLMFPLVVNAANFMDGINGISAAHGLVLGTMYAVLLTNANVDAGAWPLMGVALAGVSVAFLPWNWRRHAAMFLGDSGSYLLGAVVGLMAMACWALGVNCLVALAPLAIYLVDVGATLARRAFAGESLMTAHRDHAYQRLVQAGWTHRGTALFVSVLSALCGILGVSTQRGWIPVGVMVPLVAVLAVIYLWSPTIAGKRRSRWAGVLGS